MRTNKHLRKPINPDITETQKAWMAGIFDGEGYVGIRYRTVYTHKRRVFRLWVSISNTYKPALELIKKITGIGCIYDRKQPTKNFKTTYEYILADYGAEQFLRMIFPYSVIKREQIELALQFRRLGQKVPFEKIPEENLRIAGEMSEEMKRLKRKQVW